jgi:hypothetical protein
MHFIFGGEGRLLAYILVAGPMTPTSSKAPTGRYCLRIACHFYAYYLNEIKVKFR